jgi:AraC family transcriptional regulator
VLPAGGDACAIATGAAWVVALTLPDAGDDAFATVHRGSVALRAALARLALMSRGQASAGAIAAELYVVRLALAAEQRQFDAAVARCPGRTLAQRRDLFARLLAARDEIALKFDAARLDRLAAVAGLSTFHFLRVFRQVFGETPHDMTRRCRLEHARELLSEGVLSVSEVAHRIGMRNRCAFARLFRDWFGMPPSAVRPAPHDSIPRAPARPDAGSPERPAPVRAGLDAAS